MNVLYVVASNKEYFEKTFPVFIATVPRNKRDSFIFVVNGSEKVYEEEIDKVRIRYVTDNSYEYSPLIDLIRHQNAYKADFIFLLEDTCSLGRNFFKLAVEPDPSLDSKAVNSLEQSMGWLKKNFILSKKSFILSMENCSLETRLKNRGKLFKIGVNTSSFPRIRKILPRKNIYGIAPRIVEHYTGIDLYKYRTNIRESNRYVEE